MKMAHMFITMHGASTEDLPIYSYLGDSWTLELAVNVFLQPNSSTD